MKVNRKEKFFIKKEIKIDRFENEVVFFRNCLWNGPWEGFPKNPLSNGTFFPVTGWLNLITHLLLCPP